MVKSPLTSNNRQKYSRKPSTGFTDTPSRLRYINQRRELPGLMAPRCRKAVPTNFFSHNLQLSACFETAFTGVEPHTRIVSQNKLTLLGQSNSSTQSLSMQEKTDLSLSNSMDLFGNLPNQEKPFFHRSLEHLRSKSGGYVNVAAFGSADGLIDSPMEQNENCKTFPAKITDSRSISSFDCDQWMTGLSPSMSELSLVTTASSQSNSDYENTRYMSHVIQSSSEESPLGCEGQLINYRTSPSTKRLIGRRKGLEHYYGNYACRPGKYPAFSSY